VSSKVELYEAIATRERASRKEAERLLDAKSLELYDKSKNLENSRDKLGEMASLLSHIMTSAPDCIFTCSNECQITGVNRTTEERFDTTEAELVGKTIDSIFPGLSAKLKDLSDGRFALEGLVAKADKIDAFPVEIRGKSGKVYGNVKYVLIAQDVTEKKKAEENAKLIEQQINEARRLESIGVLSAGIAHEINTPIQFIGDNLGFLIEALLKIKNSYDRYDHLKAAALDDGNYVQETREIEDYNQKVKLQNLISDIEASVVESIGGIQQVRDIVLLMKEFSHPGALEAEPTDLNKLISDVIKICRSRSKGVAVIETEFDENLPVIECLRGQIQQVFMNLIINAIDAIDESGQRNGKVFIQTRTEHKHVQIDICDTGGGIPDKIKSLIFDPFYTTKPVGKGTGQGLALAKNTIVNVHNGKLTLAERSDYSTTFRIELPNIEVKKLKLEDIDNEHAA